MGHSKYKFKSVGNKRTDRRFDNSEVTNIQNIGIKTPVSSTGNKEIFDMHTDFRAQLRDNLKNLIMTNQGERLARYDFGANLKSVLYDYTKEKKYNETIKELIVNAAERHIPVIKITQIESVVLTDLEKLNANRAGLAKLRIRVFFEIPSVRVTNQAVEVEMFIGG